MSNEFDSPLFPLEGLSEETFIRLPKTPDAQSASVKLYVVLAEPNVFVEGFSKSETQDRPAAVLRGCVFVRVSRPVKIKSINLKFTGYSRTEWPEGIPPKKVDHHELNSLTQHTWPLFAYTESYPSTDTSKNNAQLYIPPNGENDDLPSFSLDALSPITSPFQDDSSLHPVTSGSLSSLAGVLKRATSPSPFNRATSHSLFTKLNSSDAELISVRSAEDAQNTKLFIPGDYIYSFEHIIPPGTPESSNVTFGAVEYNLDAFLERSGTFKSSLHANKPVNIVRTLSQESSEESEPIVISRDWETHLHYEVVVSSKSVLLNSYLPVAFKLVPLEKIKIHRVRIYITEHLEYFCRGKKVHRTEPPKKFLLLEHKPDGERDSLLIDDVNEDEITARELEFQVFVPEHVNDKQRIHPDTSYDNIQSHHWIKICMRISRTANDPEDKDKRKHFELSIDSPIHILSALCVHANTLLPAYVGNDNQLYLNGNANGNVNGGTGVGGGDPSSVSPPPPPLPLYNDTPLSPGVEAVGFNHNHNGVHQMLDSVMVAKPNMNLESNLYKPDDSYPIEYKSPQAQPFSPVVSPQLQAIHPEVLTRNQIPMSSSITRPIHLLRRPSFNPPAFTDDIPPPTFNGDLPPSYDTVLKEDERHASEFKADEDLGSTFSFGKNSPDMPAAIVRATSPIPSLRSTSPHPMLSSPPSPNLKRKNQNVAKDITNVLANKSANSSSSSNAIDAALADAITSEQEKKKPQKAEDDTSETNLVTIGAPTPVRAFTPPSHESSSDSKVESPIGIGIASSPPRVSHVVNANPLRHPSLLQSERRSSVSSNTSNAASVISESSYLDPAVYQPLLRDDSFTYSRHNSVFDGNGNGSSLFGSSHGLVGNGSASDFYIQREQEPSIDITSMYPRGSIVDSSASLVPSHVNQNDPSFHVFNVNSHYNNFNTTEYGKVFNSRLTKKKKNAPPAGADGLRLDFNLAKATALDNDNHNDNDNTNPSTLGSLSPVQRRISFGVEPIMAALSVASPSSPGVGGHQGPDYMEPHVHDSVPDSGAATTTKINETHEHLSHPPHTASSASYSGSAVNLEGDTNTSHDNQSIVSSQTKSSGVSTLEDTNQMKVFGSDLAPDSAQVAPESVAFAGK